MPKTRSGLASTEHPSVSNIDAWGEKHDGTYEREWRINWFMNNMNMSRDEAEKAEEAINYYSLEYEDIHQGKDVARNDIIDKTFDNPLSPVFVGDTFRGLYVSPSVVEKIAGGNSITPREYLQNVVDSGIWKEPGATSFSSSRKIAEGFGKFYMDKSDGSVSVLVHYSDGKSGMPIKHLSEIPRENEVLHSGRQMKDGMPITKYEWTNSGRELHIYVTDNEPSKKRR